MFFALSGPGLKMNTPFSMLLVVKMAPIWCFCVVAVIFGGLFCGFEPVSGEGT